MKLSWTADLVGNKRTVINRYMVNSVHRQQKRKKKDHNENYFGLEHTFQQMRQKNRRLTRDGKFSKEHRRESNSWKHGYVHREQTAAQH